jgi:hypothetical protein
MNSTLLIINLAPADESALSQPSDKSEESLLDSDTSTTITHFGPPANESATAVDCMTSFEKYFLKLKPQTKHVLRAMSFHDRALMCSTTIERNEIYHKNIGLLRADESTLIKDLLAGLLTKLSMLSITIQKYNNMFLVSSPCAFDDMYSRLLWSQLKNLTFLLLLLTPRAH